VREETGLMPQATTCATGHREPVRDLQKAPKRYARGVTHNLEHVFSLAVPGPCGGRSILSEHLSYQWLPWREAAAITIFSWTNRDAILALPQPFRRQ